MILIAGDDGGVSLKERIGTWTVAAVEGILFVGIGIMIAAHDLKRTGHDPVGRQEGDSPRVVIATGNGEITHEAKTILLDAESGGVEIAERCGTGKTMARQDLTAVIIQVMHIIQIPPTAQGCA